jgi:hypothetical protein
VSEGLIAGSLLLMATLLLVPVIIVAGPVLGFMIASGLWH